MKIEYTNPVGRVNYLESELDIPDMIGLKLENPGLHWFRQDGSDSIALRAGLSCGNLIAVRKSPEWLKCAIVKAPELHSAMNEELGEWSDDTFEEPEDGYDEDDDILELLGYLPIRARWKGRTQLRKESRQLQIRLQTAEAHLKPLLTQRRGHTLNTLGGRGEKKIAGFRETISEASSELEPLNHLVTLSEKLIGMGSTEVNKKDLKEKKKRIDALNEEIEYAESSISEIEGFLSTDIKSLNTQIREIEKEINDIKSELDPDFVRPDEEDESDEEDLDDFDIEPGDFYGEA